jgi:CRISPR-associated protein Csb1
MQITQSLKDKNVVAVISTEFLEPAFGKGTTIQPATYADHGYNIAGGIAAIDSVQSQANRLEAIFKQEPYAKLVPQVVVNTMNLLELGHRLADAVMSYSSGNQIVRKALQGAAKGDFIPLAKINPTALLLGIWDSRNNGVKVARTLGFTVDANGVTTVRDRAAQYRASIDAETKTALESHLNAGENSEKRTRTRLSEEGFNDVPSFDPKKGGCIAAEVVRRGVLNFVPLRKYDEKLQNYLLGLGLVMLTYPLDHSYRSGTLLVQDAARPATLELIYRNGKREAVEITHEQALVFAQDSAGAFGVGPDQTFVLDNETYKKYQKSGTGEKKAEPAKKAMSKTVGADLN